MSSSQPRVELLDSLEMRAIRRGLHETEVGPDANSSRQEIKTWVQNHPNEQESFLQELVTAAKQVLLDENENYLEYIDVNQADDDDRSLVEVIDLFDAYYYDSFFGYTDHSTKLYSIDEPDGIFAEIADEAGSIDEAKTLFIEHCQDRDDIDEAYLAALDEVPAPLIGEIEHEARPRLVKFEDSNHLYIELWSIGDTFSKFDVNEGDYKTIESLARTVVRVHLDTGILEYTSDDTTKGHRQSVLTDLLELSNQTSNPGSDQATNYSEKIITDRHIRQIKENVGVLSTLDSFRGARANLRYSSVDDRNVETDPTHGNMERSRDYQKSHPRVLVGWADGRWELIKKDDLVDDSDIDLDEASFEEEDAVSNVIREIKEQGQYDRVRQFTIPMNSDKDTLRIWKKRCSPETRRTVFHLIAGELGW